MSGAGAPRKTPFVTAQHSELTRLTFFTIAIHRLYLTWISTIIGRIQLLYSTPSPSTPRRAQVLHSSVVTQRFLTEG